MEIVKVRIGEFVKEHIPQLVEYLKEYTHELELLKTIDYSKKVFETISYPFIQKVDEIDKPERYWMQKTEQIGHQCRLSSDTHAVSNRTVMPEMIWTL